MTTSEKDSREVKDAQRYLDQIREGTMDVTPASEWKDGWNVMSGAFGSLKVWMNRRVEFDSVDEALHFLEAYDEAVLCGLIRKGRGLPAKLEEAQHTISELKETLLAREKSLKSANDEVHERDARIRKLENLLMKHGIDFGGEESVVA